MTESPRPPSKVSLEDLLRLKRAERPDAAFWAEFESQLRRKQLAAIVVKRPWWRRVSLSALRKISLPAGATAVVAVTLFTLRQQPSSPALATHTTQPTVPAAVATLPEPSSLPRSEATAAPPASTLIADTAPSRPPAVSGDSASSHRVSSSAVVAAPVNRAASDSAGSIDTTYALAQVVLGFSDKPQGEQNSVLEAALTSVSDSPSPELNPLSENVAGGTLNPSLEVGYPRGPRSPRLLASLDASYGGDAIGDSRVERARERITSRLTEQSLYDSISRLGLNANKVSIKF